MIRKFKQRECSHWRWQKKKKKPKLNEIIYSTTPWDLLTPLIPHILLLASVITSTVHANTFLIYIFLALSKWFNNTLKWDQVNWFLYLAFGSLFLFCFLNKKKALRFAALEAKFSLTKPWSLYFTSHLLKETLIDWQLY